MAYDSITLPTRTRPEHPYAMDMYDITARVNIHGQRKFVESDIAVLFDQSSKDDLMTIGWKRLTGQKRLTATIFRGTVNKVDELSKIWTQNDIITEQ